MPDTVLGRQALGYNKIVVNKMDGSSPHRTHSPLRGRIPMVVKKMGFVS